jgi:transposase
MEAPIRLLQKRQTPSSDPPSWFIKPFADHFYLPSAPVFTKQTANKHSDVYNYIHPEQFPLDLEWINLSEPLVLKTFNKSIQQTKEDIKSCIDLIELKKLNTKLKTLQTKEDKILTNTGKVIKTMSYQLHFNEKQKQTVFSWMKECLSVYNECIYLSNIQKDNLPTTLNTLRAVVFNRLYGNDPKPAPYDTLGDEVRLFLSNRKSCLTSLSRKNITHFELKTRMFRDFMSINIPATSVNKSSVFKDLLGHIKGWSDIYKRIQENCQGSTFCDCRLVYDKLIDCFLLKVPYYTTPVKILGRKKVVSVDPGEKIFMSYYSPEQSGHIGYDIRNPILKEQKKIKKIDSLLKSRVNKKGTKLKNAKRLKIQRKMIFRRIKNIVSELHHQTASWLTTNYDRVYIPKFDTQQMLKRSENIKGRSSIKKFNRLNKRYKFVLQQLSHFRFRQHLLNKGQEKGCKIEIVNESYTSQCCGGCGRLSKTYNLQRVKKCQCGCEIDRDLNGARNILLKTLCEYNQ